MPYRLVAEQALARWRAAQAAMQAAEPQTDEWQAAYLEEQRAKAAYQEAVEAARREHLPSRHRFLRRRPALIGRCGEWFAGGAASDYIPRSNHRIMGAGDAASNRQA